LLKSYLQEPENMPIPPMDQLTPLRAKM